MEKSAPISNEPTQQVKPGNGLTGQCFSLFFRPFVQTKLTVNEPGDEYEQEADAVADKIMRMSDAKNNIFFKPALTHVHRKCAHCEEEENLQRKESNAETSAGETAERYLNSLSGGKSLNESERSFFEARIGYDFGNVRVHNDSAANESAKSINALAYTHGNNIVFGSNQYQPENEEGKKLLAHELTHVVQQEKLSLKPVQKQATNFGPGASGVPANWSAQVAAATTSAQKAALIQTAIGASVTVVDKTADSAADRSPDPAHLSAYSASSRTINYDDNLASKTARSRTGTTGRSLSSDAGYTLDVGSAGTNFYIILSPLAISSSNYYTTVQTLNHEFDHVQQGISRSTLRGNESELDAWTSSFIRDFHTTYILRNTGSVCVVSFNNQFAPLQFYYSRPDVSATQQDAAVARITTYYTGTISPHPAHSKVFRYWIYRMLSSANPQLVTRLNTDLSLSIVASAPAANYRQFPCTADITGATFPSPPSASQPTFPSGTSPGHP